MHERFRGVILSAQLWIDLETSGLGDNAAVLEIAAIAVIDGEKKHHFQSYIRPHENATLDPKAFEVNKININDIWSFPDANMVINTFLDYVDSFERTFTLSGHNVAFDIKKLFKFFCRNGSYSEYLTRFRPGGIDTLTLSKKAFKNSRNKPTGFSLEKLCQHFEINLDNAHSALPDITATIQIYNELSSKNPSVEVTKIEKMPYREKRRKYMDSKYIQLNPDGDIFITSEATSSPQIIEFILTELYDIYGEKHYEKN